MDQRRQFLTFLVATALFVAWMQLAPILFPNVGFFGKPPRNAPPQPPAQPAAPVDEAAVPPAVVANADSPNSDDPDAAENPEPDAPAPLPEFPALNNILIGDVDDEGTPSGYLLRVELSTQGAAVNWARLTDRDRDNPYTYLDNKNEMIKVIGNPVQRNVGPGAAPRSFETSVQVVDALLKQRGTSLAAVNWKIEQQTPDSVTFSYPSPAGDIELVKTFSVPKLSTEQLARRDVEPTGYMLNFDFTIRNLTAEPIATKYALVGPVGLPLEDPANTTLYREVKVGTLSRPQNPDRITSINLRAADLVSEFDDAAAGGDPIKDWREPIKYAGIDSQFFAALISPVRNQLEDLDKDGVSDPDFAIVRPELLELNRKYTMRSDFTLVLESDTFTIPANGAATNKMQVFLGPKRPALLAPLGAEPILQMGQFMFWQLSWVAAVSKGMLYLLTLFHTWIGLPYALCIILLTVVVRSLMLPISRKQVAEMEKGRILAPELKKIQEQHKNQPEEFARAYREFQRKHNYHPMAGCLPSLIQLPIFIGLYNSLYHAVDLRLAKFLWIDNLAAPDALFQFGFTIPFLTWTEFNLLPFLTVGLMVLQQKLFMPPPTSEEQAMQFRMMNIMMLAMGFAFYRVPAGLCLYFIASSLWGMAERLLLKKPQTPVIAAEGATGAPSGTAPPAKPLPAPAGNGSRPAATQRKLPGWVEKMLEAADKAKNPHESHGSERKFSKGKGKGQRPR